MNETIRERHGEVRTSRVPHRVAYPLAALALAFGAPFGLAAVRLASCDGSAAACARADLAAEWPTYVYVAVSTALVFAAFGRYLGVQADRLAALSETDALTGLANSRVLHSRIAQELARAERYGHPLSLLLLDVDGLKGINDAAGHEGGNRALTWVADAIRAQMRTTDLGARWGGDEFAVLAPNTAAAPAATLAERLRASIAAAPAERRVTASIGVATIERGHPGAVPRDPVEVMQRADAALYAAKRAGRNRVVAAEGEAQTVTAAGR